MCSLKQLEGQLHLHQCKFYEKWDKGSCMTFMPLDVFFILFFFSLCGCQMLTFQNYSIFLLQDLPQRAEPLT